MEVKEDNCCHNNYSRHKKFLHSNHLSDIKIIVEEILEKTRFVDYDEYMKSIPTRIKKWAELGGILIDKKFLEERRI